MEFKDRHIEIEPPRRPKKLTATRFASVMGLNDWCSPFKAWCAITRTWEDPFTESRYTVAGKIIEGKVIDYLNKVYYMDVKSPADVYGADYFKRTRGDFFPTDKIFGGMWDALGDDFVVEIKTTKRAEDWALDVPIYYKLQAALYAYLLGFEHVTMTSTFLAEEDYPTLLEDGTWDTAATEAFVPSVENTRLWQFDLHEAFPNFEDNYITPAQIWWHEHVDTGVSPDYDERRDADPLRDLRKVTWVPDDRELEKLVREADKLQDQVDRANARIAEKVTRLREIDGLVKRAMAEQIPDGGKAAEYEGRGYVWTITRKAGRSSIDSKALRSQEPDVYQRYLKVGEPTYALTKRRRETGDD